MAELTGSVGGGGANKVHDVCLVQVILKAIKTPKGRPYVTFGYDGTLGLNGATHNAIKAFQKDYDTLKGIPKETLGKIEKNGATFKKMVGILPGNMKNLATIENLKLVYIEGSAAAARSSGQEKGTGVFFWAGLSPSLPLSSKRPELGFPGGGVTLVLGKLGGGAGRRSNGKCRSRRSWVRTGLVRVGPR